MARDTGAEGTLASPQFSVEFVQHVSAVRPGVEVAILSRGLDCVGFLPFFRTRHNAAEPVADRLSDMQGMIAERDLPWNIHDVLRSARLRCLKFREWIESQETLRPYFAVRVERPYMDLSNGFEAYRRERRASGTNELRELMRKIRKIEREVGTTRFVPYETDHNVLQTLLDWKCAQLSRRFEPTGLTQPWCRALFERVLQDNSTSFAGMLSALYIGDELIAAIMAMRSQHVLHGWVIAYNPTYAKYSPGLLLLTKLAQAAESLGLRWIDMGRGSDPYKQSLRSAGVMVAEGSVHRNVCAGWVRRTGLQRANGCVLLR